MAWRSGATGNSRPPGDRGSDDDLEERLERLRAALQQASKAGLSVDVTVGHVHGGPGSALEAGTPSEAADNAAAAKGLGSNDGISDADLVLVLRLLWKVPSHQHFEALQTSWWRVGPRCHS